MSARDDPVAIPAGWATEPTEAGSQRIHLIHERCGQRSRRDYHPELDQSWMRSHLQYHMCPDEVVALPSRLPAQPGLSGSGT